MIKLYVRVIHTEHAYVQYPFFEVRDEDLKLHTQLMDFIKAQGVQMYGNHFVLECIDGCNVPMYLGYNDGTLSIGSQIGKISDSVAIKITQRRIRLKL